MVHAADQGDMRQPFSLERLDHSLGHRDGAVLANRASPLAAAADLAVVIPDTDTGQFGGSLFEQSALVLFDAIAFSLQRKLGLGDEQMQARHATLE